MQLIITNMKQQLIEETAGFHEALWKHRSKTLAVLLKAIVSNQTECTKTIKADRKLLQPLLNAVTAGRIMEMVNILKHELSPISLSLAKHGCDLNSTPKGKLISILMVGLHTPSDVPEADMKICMLIDGHGHIQALGKPHGCQMFGDYADVFMQNV